MASGDAAPAPAAASRLAARTRTAASDRAVLARQHAVVGVLERFRAGRIHLGQVAGVGFQRALADLRLLQPAADSLVGHEAGLPVRDAALLGQLTEPPLEIIDAPAALHAGRREVPHVIAVLRLLA